MFNLNWEISTKNLVTFKRWERVKEYPIYRGELPEKGAAWTVWRFKRGLGEKEGGGVFEGVDTPMRK